MIKLVCRGQLCHRILSTHAPSGDQRAKLTRLPKPLLPVDLVAVVVVVLEVADVTSSSSVEDDSATCSSPSESDSWNELREVSGDVSGDDCRDSELYHIDVSEAWFARVDLRL